MQILLISMRIVRGGDHRLAHIVERRVGIHHAHIQHLAVLFRTHGKVGIAVQAELIGPVEDFPVPKSAIAVQADTARADSAYRKTDFPAHISAIYLCFHPSYPPVRTAFRF